VSLEILKSILATVVLGLALAQATSGVRLRGHFRSLPVPARLLRPWHRVGGDAVLSLTVAVALICITGFSLTPYGIDFPLHAWLATIAVAAMLAKLIIARRRRRLVRHNLALGLVAGLAVLGVFVASALQYVIVTYFM
jgi:hypothetical protein